MGEWRRVRLGKLLTESKILSVNPNPDKRITVRLHVKGVEKRPFTEEKAGATKYFVRHSGQFIYGKQNFQKGAFGIIPPELDGFESSLDLPAFDVSEECLPEWLVYWFRTDHRYGNLSKIARGAGSQRVAVEDIYQFEIVLPSVGSQAEILFKLRSIERINNAIDEEKESQLLLLKQLRQAVLQEAVEGKLTADWRKQHPVVKSDPQYDALALLARIKAEKERLIKAGKIRKEKPLPPIADKDKPFELPEGWVWRRLGAVADGFQYGSSAKSIKDGKYPVLRMGNIQGGKIDWDDLVFTNNEEEAKKYRLTEGDLLFNRTNSRELVGKTGLFDGRRKAIFAGYLIRVSMLGKISPTYSNFVLNSKHHRDWCDENKADALGQSNINATKLRDFHFPLPPLAEQQAIVARVDSLMDMIDGLEQQVAERKEQAQMLMQAVLREAFAGGIEHADDHALSTVEYPEERVSEVLLSLVAEPVASYLPQRKASVGVAKKRHAGHDMYNKAALAAYITTRCSNGQRPVGKVKVMKLHYLIQRKAEVALTEAFVRRPAGPVDDAIHQAIHLAGKQGWLKVLKKQGNSIPIIPGANPHPAIEQVKKYFGESFNTVDQMLETMKSWGWEALERWATVEPLARELLDAGKEPTLAAIKAALAADPVWKEKLKKGSFSDANIASTLRGLREFDFLIPVVLGAERQLAPVANKKPPHSGTASPVVAEQQRTINGGNIPQSILAAMQPGRAYSRAELLAATGISETDWTWAIRQLKEEGQVVQEGEKRGARYRRTV